MVPAVHVLAGVLSALTLPALPTLQSTDAATWASVRQVAAGEHMRVELIHGGPIEGQMKSADADSVTVARGHDEQRVARTSVRRVAVARGSHRKRNVLIGMATGGVVSIVGVAIGCAGASAGCMESSPAYFYPAIGAGALVGATLPATAWQTVYLLAPQ